MAPFLLNHGMRQACSFKPTLYICWRFPIFEVSVEFPRVVNVLPSELVCFEKENGFTIFR